MMSPDRLPFSLRSVESYHNLNFNHGWMTEEAKNSNDPVLYVLRTWC